MENNNQDFFEQYKGRLMRYITNRILLAKLEGVSKASKLVSMMVTWMLLGIISCLILLFLSFMGGYFFSELFNSYFKGFGLVALIYVILLIVIILLMKKQVLKKFIAGKIIAIIFEKTANDEEDGHEQPKN
jgi:hypothetical protein